LVISDKFEVLSSKDEVIVIAAKAKVEVIEDTAPVQELPPEETKEEKAE